MQEWNNFTQEYNIDDIAPYGFANSGKAVKTYLLVNHWPVVVDEGHRMNKFKWDEETHVNSPTWNVVVCNALPPSRATGSHHEVDDSKEEVQAK